VKLSNTERPRMAEPTKRRVAEVLDAGCPCGGPSAMMTKRMIAGAVTIHLQCQTCGSSLLGSLKRAEHYFYQDYPKWEDGLRDRYWAAQRGEANEYIVGRNAAFQDRQTEYREEFLRSPEWREMRQRVLNRAGNRCEACLTAPARDVHHVSYRHGKLPPAWELRAICRECHEQLHALDEVRAP
jgi:hypothetical protein